MTVLAGGDGIDGNGAGVIEVAIALVTGELDALRSSNHFTRD